MHWRRKWQLTPVFLPGESHGQRRLVGYSPWGCRESGIAEQLTQPITLWQIDGETVETVADFMFLSSKITANGDCSHEIRRHLLLGKKAMTNLDSTLKVEPLLCHQRSI